MGFNWYLNEGLRMRKLWLWAMWLMELVVLMIIRLGLLDAIWLSTTDTVVLVILLKIIWGKCFLNFLITFKVPIDVTNGIQVLYVFVDIQIDLNHLIETIKLNFPDKEKTLAMVSTIQFATSTQVSLKLHYKWLNKK